MGRHKEKINIQQGGEHGRTALHIAAIYDHEECARVLVRFYKERYSSLLFAFLYVSKNSWRLTCVVVGICTIFMCSKFSRLYISQVANDRVLTKSQLVMRKGNQELTPHFWI